MKLGLIGFSRQGLVHDTKYYNLLVQTVIDTIPTQSHLISGGSIWCDHIAVTLYLNGQTSGLTLHLPDHWSFETKSFAGTTSSGCTLNTLHGQFSKSLGQNTLNDIDQALRKGAQYTVSGHFFDRNTLIAQNCEVLYAIVIKDSKMTPGTCDTWKKCVKPKYIIYVPTC
jgi:hypothetical protein